MCAPGLLVIGSGIMDSMTTGAGLTAKVVAGVVLSTSTRGTVEVTAPGPCTVAGVQAYSENEVKSMRSARCILNIRKSWNPHYM